MIALRRKGRILLRPRMSQSLSQRAAAGPVLLRRGNSEAQSLHAQGSDESWSMIAGRGGAKAES
jgi:hypothetical protein